MTGRWVRSLRWCSRATDIGTIAIPVPEATTSKASLTVISGKSSGARGGDLVPALDLAGHELLVGEIGERDLVVRRDRVLERHHDHGDLLVERDQVQAVAVDREAHEAHVGPSVAQHGFLVGLLHEAEVEGDARLALPPGPSPLVGGDAGDERDPERFLHGVRLRPLTRASRDGLLGGGPARPRRSSR